MMIKVESNKYMIYFNTQIKKPQTYGYQLTINCIAEASKCICLKNREKRTCRHILVKSYLNWT